MKRVLIIGPDFTPSSHPPALRILFFAQHLREFGWEPTVLTTDPRYYESIVDAENEKLLPPDLEVIRTCALPASLTRHLGVGDVGLRSLWHHWRELYRLCRQRKIDLIFVPVPPNSNMILGRLAHARFGIPYVIDYIDPVATDYYWKLPREQRPPKYALAYVFERAVERFAVRHAKQIVGVSKGTTDGVIARYPWLDPAAATEIPYGGEPNDFEYLRRHPRKNRHFNPVDGYVHVSYIGAYTLSMEPVVRVLFAGIREGRAHDPQLFSRLRLHFVGTNYTGTDGEQRIRSIAADYGISDLVEEHAARVPYLDALNLLLDSHALLAIGSVEPHYTASKIFPYILAAKPLLAIFHERSSVVSILTEMQSGQVVTFGDLCPLSESVGEIGLRFRNLLQLPKNFQPAVRWEAFEAYTTRAMTARLAIVLDKAVGGQSAPEVVQTSALIANGKQG